MTDLSDSVRQNIEVIASKYFVDTTRVGSMAHGNIFLMTACTLLNEGAYVIGSPGFGKTTLGKTVFASTYGLPLGLLDGVQIECHPEVTQSSSIGRADFHALMNTGEETVWNLAWYFPCVALDEFNRLPAGKQNILLTALANGSVVSPLGHTLTRQGKRAVVATSNFDDSGTNSVLPPMYDRFGVCLELSDPGALYSNSIKSASLVRKKALNWSPKSAEDLLDKLRGKDSNEKKLKCISDLMEQGKEEYKKSGITCFSEKELEAVRAEIDKVPFSIDARLFADCIQSELNNTVLYGANRACDERDSSTHGIMLASNYVKNSFSPRARIALEGVAKTLAWLEKRSVEKKDIALIVPYVLAHRLIPTRDFSASIQGVRWVTRNWNNFELSYRLINGPVLIDGKDVGSIESRYELVKTQLQAINEYYTLLNVGNINGLEQQKKDIVAGLIKNKTVIDHPLVRQYVEFLSEKIVTNS